MASLSGCSLWLTAAGKTYSSGWRLSSSKLSRGRTFARRVTHHVPAALRTDAPGDGWNPTGAPRATNHGRRPLGAALTWASSPRQL